MEPIILPGENGEQIKLFVVEETKVSGHKYLLVCDSEDENEDADASILKEVAATGEESVYEFVEDDVEFEAVAKVFEELVGDDADLDF
ncbi:MAG: DUF1292 domain-containing protein [Pseudobutyrivibrio sp.]|uniref:DUF1292 domain-containing protein n=1 Tax=Pseudobutyrivibrio ruminis TaxID=46206 RepID=A0A927U8Z7_9FIRM|nr:DUF1292 domain-containing protein [Pseudobutyrivibrio sp.]MBE5920529.1 DUF1292 domain-containing protein [Pseudobutyrivibrio ruminis]MBQ3772902.1 DUF1292 domain-containing protein [Pseudobutyrivibrio sp.]MBQ6464183.1 DUF1292 domain-containing protein [Pseudobutyrivibrio sp.]MBQ8489054.1 DUF1292 domain-containing protein [Pseudobutyrivibrio sp.]